MNALRSLARWFRNLKRDAERDRRIQFLVSIPYNEDNEFSLRSDSTLHDGKTLTMGHAQEVLKQVIQGALVLKDVRVKCVANPNWRSG